MFNNNRDDRPKNSSDLNKVAKTCLHCIKKGFPGKGHTEAECKTKEKDSNRFSFASQNKFNVNSPTARNPKSETKAINTAELQKLLEEINSNSENQ